MQAAHLHGDCNLPERFNSSCEGDPMNSKIDDAKELLDALSLFIMEASLSVCFMGVVFVILYGLLFVMQPMSGQSPNDKAMFAILTPLAIFLPTIMREMIAMKRNKPLPPQLPTSMTQAYEPPAPPPPPKPAPVVTTTTTVVRQEPTLEAAPVNIGYGGKKAPPPAFEPEI